MNDEMLTEACRALGDPTRARIVRFLSNCCCGQAAIRDDGAVEGPTAGEVCCHVTGESKITSTVSHHLHELAEAGLVTLEKRGRATLCRLNPDGLRGVAQALTALADGLACPRECCDGDNSRSIRAVSGEPCC